jgi:RHS repeat-associated protein
MRSPWGQVVERYAYNPYGQVTILSANYTVLSASQYGAVYLWQGGRLDAVTGLYQFGARDYSPTQGRWLEVDPAGQAGSGTNLYESLSDNPVNGTDPSGEWLNIVIGAGVGTVIGAGVAWYRGGDVWQVIRGAGVGAGVGAVAGATFGASLAAGGALAGGVGITAGSGVTGTVTGIGITAVSGVAAGQAGRLTGNLLEGRNATCGLGNPSDMVIDAVLGVVFQRLNGPFNKVLQPPEIAPGGMVIEFPASANAPGLPRGPGYTGNPPPSLGARPPGWDPNTWTWGSASGEAEAAWRWWDPNGGEWRWHAPDTYHNIGHWDYNPWTTWNSGWQNIYP